jgi:hypothetical protein
MVGTTRKLAAKSSSLYATFAAGVFPHNCRPLDCARGHESSQPLVERPAKLQKCDLGYTGLHCSSRALSDTYCQFVRRQRWGKWDYLRQVAGRYLSDTVPPLQLQVILPARVMAESTSVLDLMLLFALGA